MRDIGGLVWIVFVLFAVISSIVKSARRARSGVGPAQAVTQPRAVVRPQMVTQPQRQPPPIAQPVPQPVPPAPQPVPPPPPATQPRIAISQRQPRAKGLFADRDALIRGIVAAEVLGKPLALRDE